LTKRKRVLGGVNDAALVPIQRLDHHGHAVLLRRFRKLADRFNAPLPVFGGVPSHGERLPDRGRNHDRIVASHRPDRFNLALKVSNRLLPVEHVFVRQIMPFGGPPAVAGESADLKRKVPGQLSDPICVKIIDRGGQVNAGVTRGRNEGEYFLKGRVSKRPATNGESHNELFGVIG
jgi:hypothetical protein